MGKFYWLLAAGLLALGTATAQQEVGTMFFTADESGHEWGTPYCAVVPTFLMASEPPAPGKAYAAVSTAATSCQTAFIYPVKHPVNLTGDAQVRFWLACDTPSPGETASGADMFLVRLASGHLGVAETVVTGFVDHGPVACGAPYEVNVTISTQNMELKRGDVLSIFIEAYYANGVPNMHYLVGPDFPARLEAEGLQVGEDPGPPGGTIYFGSEDIGAASGAGTCTTQRRYALSLDVPPERRAAASASTGSFTCRTIFVLPVSAPMALQGDAEVRFWIACERPTAGWGTGGAMRFSAILSNQATSSEANDDVAYSFDGPRVCGEPHEVVMQVPTGDLIVAAGGFLALHIWSHYATGGGGADENVWYVVGGDYPSSITAVGLRGDGEKIATPLEPTMFLSSAVSGTIDSVDCGVVSTFTLAEPLPDGATIDVGRMDPRGGCPLLFVFNATERFVVDDATRLQFWSSCSQGTLHGGFAAYLARDQERFTNQAGTQLGAPEAYHVCSDEPRPWVFTLQPMGATTFEVGQQLIVRIFAGGANPPPDSGTSFVQLLVGGDYPSGISGPDLPTNVVQIDSASEEQSPGLGLLASVGILFLARRRWLGLTEASAKLQTPRGLPRPPMRRPAWCPGRPCASAVQARRRQGQ